MSFDPIADMLTRLQNASKVNKESTLVPFSKLLWSILEVLKQEDLIVGFDKVSVEGRDFITVNLKYKDSGRSAIEKVKRVSRLSQRRYASSKDLWSVRGGYGLLVVSTSQGIKTGKQAKKEGVGGEVLFEVW